MPPETSPACGALIHRLHTTFPQPSLLPPLIAKITFSVPRARGLPQKLHQIGAALLLSAHPVSSPITDKPQASTTVTVSNNLFIETERSSPQKYRPFDAPLLPQFPTVRPRFEKLHLDDLRDSQAPAVSEAPSQYLGPSGSPHHSP